MWKNLFLDIMDGKENLNSPFHPDGRIKAVFVMVKSDERLGYLYMWCDKTLRGVHISRLTIPDSVLAVDMDRMEEVELPDIIFEDFD